MEWLRKRWEFAGLLAAILGGLLRIVAREKIALWGGWTAVAFLILVIGKVLYDRSPALQAAVGRFRRATDSESTQPEGRLQAFRGLLPFREKDAPEFAKLGRQIDVAALLPAVRDPSLRVVVLRGDSGCGKTSLISAGLLPTLRGEGWRIVEINPDTPNPAGLIWGGDGAATNSNTLIVADQFEEHFLRALPEGLPDIATILRNSVERKQGKWLIGVRADFKYFVDDLIELYRGTFETELLKPRVGYGLKLFNISQAKSVISELGEQVFDAGVSLLLAQDLSRGGNVLPADIQFVGYEMQVRNIRTLDDYQKAGGRDGIIADSIRSVIEQFSTEDRRANARKILNALIDPERRTRLAEALTAEELGARAGVIGDIRGYCEPFIKQRLILRVTHSTAKQIGRYRLAHDYLVQPILTAIGRTESDYEKVIRLLNLYSGEYSSNAETRIPPHDYRLIQRLLRKVPDDPRLVEARRQATSVIRATAKQTWKQRSVVGAAALALVLVLPPVRNVIESNVTRRLNSQIRPVPGPLFKPQRLRMDNQYVTGLPAHLFSYGHRPLLRIFPFPETVLLSPSVSARQPQNAATALRSIALGRFDVTVAQFNAFATESGLREKPGDTDLPVVDVSWDDANSYCTWLTQVTGKHFRLPTHDEWEKACAAGRTDHPEAGALGDYVWDFENSGTNRHAVGTKKPNALGLYDMLGNVEQWVGDWDEEWSLRSTRGGNNTDKAQELNCKKSRDLDPHQTAEVVGFRCALDLPH